MQNQQHDVFISHASEDKDSFVRKLAASLRANHLDVWYDEYSLKIGDSLRASIDRGLASSRFGIVVISPDFIRKSWPVRELDGLVAVATHTGRNSILPIWHNIDKAAVLQFSPPLADVVAANSSMGIDLLVQQLLEIIRPNESPLVVARELLHTKGVETPVISNDWWIDIIELKEARFMFPDVNLDNHWMFPLPHQAETNPQDRGENIAWTALQLDWMDAAAEANISLFSPPEVVHEFIQNWPGLVECGRRNAGILALYAPQITIQGFEGAFADAFDDLLDIQNTDAYLRSYPRSSRHTTNNLPPMCGELIAWRHDTFGNYSDVELGRQFLSAHNHQYFRNPYSDWESITWLLSNESRWLPERLKERLIRGVRADFYYLSRRLHSSFPQNTFLDALVSKPRSRFRATRSVRSDLARMFETALNQVGLDDDADGLTSRFLDWGFVDAYFDEKQHSRR